jgi:hypothetical protein
MTRNEIYEILQKHVADVAFTKVDGSERVMRCTLKSDLVPAPVDKPERNRTVNESVLPVWDIDKNAWRSFRVDSVSSVQTVMV